MPGSVRELRKLYQSAEIDFSEYGRARVRKRQFSPSRTEALRPEKIIKPQKPVKKEKPKDAEEKKLFARPISEITFEQVLKHLSVQKGTPGVRLRIQALQAENFDLSLFLFRQLCADEPSDLATTLKFIALLVQIARLAPASLS